MAEFIDLQQYEDFSEEVEREFSINRSYGNNFLVVADESFDDSEVELRLFEGGPDVLEEKLALQKITVKLLKIIRSLLQLKGNLVDIEARDILECTECLIQIFDKYFGDRVELLDIKQKQSLLKEKLKFKLDFNCSLGDRENTLKATHSALLKFREAYKKCVNFLDKLFQRAKKELKISNLPRNCREYMCVIFSTYEENLSSYKIILALSKEAFKEFECLINEESFSYNECNCNIELLKNAINKASNAWDDLLSVLFNVLNI